LRRCSPVCLTTVLCVVGVVRPVACLVGGLIGVLRRGGWWVVVGGVIIALGLLLIRLTPDRIVEVVVVVGCHLESIAIKSSLQMDEVDEVGACAHL